MLSLRNSPQLDQASLDSSTLQTVAELNEILNAETTALRERKFDRIDEFTRRKSQALIQISNALHAPGRGELHPSLQEAIVALRARLVMNEQELQMHIKAAREISDTLTKLALDAESDGTYSPYSDGLDF